MKDWALRNIGTLRNVVITDLLNILRSEGHFDFPLTASTLLATRHYRPTYNMLTNRGTIASYAYRGIENALKKRICNDIYQSNTIKILVNVDGIPIFNNSKKQFWPILIQIYDKNYYFPPAVVAIFCSDSKPTAANEFLKNFVPEAKMLIENRIVIDSKLYLFQTVAFGCDTPARAFIKSVKAHNGFYGCERCKIKGIIVGRNKRVFSEVNARLRTCTSFINKIQIQHLENKTTIFLQFQIPNFNIINGEVLEYMYLLCLGVMKNLIEKWIGSRKNICRIKVQKRIIWKEFMMAIRIGNTR